MKSERPPAEPRIGEIWDASLDPTLGREQAGFRPVLVISNDWFNRLTNSLVVIAPLTRTNKGIRYQVVVQVGDGGLSAESVVMCEQVRTIDRLRLHRRRGVVSPEVLKQVREIVAAIMINDPYPE